YNREINPADPLSRFQYLEHRKTMTIAAIERQRAATGAQVNKRIPMGATEISDMDVIANAGAVWGWVVRAENFNLSPLPQSSFHCDLNQLRGSPSRLTSTIFRIGASNVEIPKAHIIDTMGLACIAKDDFGHQLRRAIRRNRQRRCIF